MKANEFRIGNIVFYNSEDDKNEPVKYICKLDGEDIWRVMQDERYLKLHKPIPLTPEILEKCGFVKAQDGFSGYLSPALGGLSSSLGGRKHRLAQDSVGAFIMTFNMYTSVTINTLHQLQNLFFAITGEELDVSQIGEKQVKSKHNLEGCDCECPENGMVSNCCPVHNYNPYPKSILDE